MDKYPHSEIISLILGGMDFLIQAIHKNKPKMASGKVTDYIIGFIEDIFPMLNEEEVTKILNTYADMQEYLEQDHDVTPQ